MSSSKWNVGKVTSWHNAFRNTHSFNQNLANWDISKLDTNGGLDMFNGAKSFNFKSELDVAWEPKNPDAYPGKSMFEGTCSLDPNCGKCGMKKTGGGTDGVAVTCSSSLPAKSVDTVCTFCKNDGAEVSLN